MRRGGPATEKVISQVLLGKSDPPPHPYSFLEMTASWKTNILTEWYVTFNNTSIRKVKLFSQTAFEVYRRQILSYVDPISIFCFGCTVLRNFWFTLRNGGGSLIVHLETPRCSSVYPRYVYVYVYVYVGICTKTVNLGLMFARFQRFKRL